jgi:Sap, sulfolipid-1-addressing protein
MDDLWTTLVPLIVGSAIVPIQIVLTILFLRSDAGRITAVAWVAGMTLARLAQGVIFGLVLSSGEETSGTSDGQGAVVSTILLAAAVLFLVTAFRQAFLDEDPDAPPPRWLALTESITSLRAFLLGAGMLLISVKLWVFTLSAIAAIADADLGRSESIVTYVVFAILAASVSIALIAIAYLLPRRAAAVLGRVGDLLTTYNRWIVMTLGFVFGAWFLVKALVGFGVL